MTANDFDVVQCLIICWGHVCIERAQPLNLLQRTCGDILSLISLKFSQNSLQKSRDCMICKEKGNSGTLKYHD